MKRYLVLVLLLGAYICASNSLAKEPSSPLSARLDPAALSETSDDGKMDIVGELIECRFLPTSESEYEKAVSNAEKAGNSYAAESLRTAARKCIGLTDEDFHQVGAILRELAEGGVTSAQLNYWRYVSPAPAPRYSLSDPSITNSSLAERSERFLLAAARQGEYSALLSLAHLHFSGELQSRDYNEAAAFIAAYEACSGKTAPAEANQIYSASKGLESEIARRSEALIEEVRCDK